jgi:hypothetical protein
VAQENFANLAQTTVSSGGTTAPAALTTETWTVADSSSFPAASSGVTQFHVADDFPGRDTELILVTNVSGVTWSVTRGVESTTPVAHSTNFKINQVVPASVFSSFVTNLGLLYAMGLDRFLP